MIVMPTLEMAQDFSKDRLQKLIEDTKILTPLFYRDRMTARSRDKTQTMLSKFFTGGRLVLVGANSTTGLSSRPIRILLCDEVDRFPHSAGKEGDPVGLAAKRTSTYWNKRARAALTLNIWQARARNGVINVRIAASFTRWIIGK